MSHFYASIQGNRGPASRGGSKASGIRGHIRGWDVGVSVTGRHSGGADIFEVRATGGSNGFEDTPVATVVLEGDRIRVYHYDDAILNDDGEELPEEEGAPAVEELPEEEGASAVLSGINDRDWASRGVFHYHSDDDAAVPFLVELAGEVFALEDVIDVVLTDLPAEWLIQRVRSIDSWRRRLASRS